VRGALVRGREKKESAEKKGREKHNACIVAGWFDLNWCTVVWGRFPLSPRPPPHCTPTVRDKCNTHWGAYRESVTFSLSGDPPMQTEYKCGHKNSTSLLNYITWFRK